MKRNSFFFSFTVRRIYGLNTQLYDIKWIINFRCVILLRFVKHEEDNQLKNNNFMTV